MSADGAIVQSASPACANRSFASADSPASTADWFTEPVTT